MIKNQYKEIAFIINHNNMALTRKELQENQNVLSSRITVVSERLRLLELNQKLTQYGFIAEVGMLIGGAYIVKSINGGFTREFYKINDIERWFEGYMHGLGDGMDCVGDELEDCDCDECKKLDNEIEEIKQKENNKDKKSK